MGSREREKRERRRPPGEQMDHEHMAREVLPEDRLTDGKQPRGDSNSK